MFLRWALVTWNANKLTSSSPLLHCASCHHVPTKIPSSLLDTTQDNSQSSKEWKSTKRFLISMLPSHASKPKTETSIQVQLKAFSKDNQPQPWESSYQSTIKYLSSTTKSTFSTVNPILFALKSWPTVPATREFLKKSTNWRQLLQFQKVLFMEYQKSWNASSNSEYHTKSCLLECSSSMKNAKSKVMKEFL